MTSSPAHPPHTSDLRELSAAEIKDVAGAGFWIGFQVGWVAGQIIYKYMTD
jgi:hypothetical protein